MSEPYELPLSERDEPTMYDDFERLCRAARTLLRHGPEANRREQLLDALERAEEWLEQDDPYQMGWVDDKGRP